MSSFSFIKSKEMEITIVIVMSDNLSLPEFNSIFFLYFCLEPWKCLHPRTMHHIKILSGPLFYKGENSNYGKRRWEGRTHPYEELSRCSILGKRTYGICNPETVSFRTIHVYTVLGDASYNISLWIWALQFDLLPYITDFLFLRTLIISAGYMPNVRHL